MKISMINYMHLLLVFVVKQMNFKTFRVTYYSLLKSGKVSKNVLI